MGVREGAPGLGPEGGDDLSLWRCSMAFRCTPILYQPSLGSAGNLERDRAQSSLSEIYSVAGLETAMRTASDGCRYHRQRMEVGAWGRHLRDSLAVVTGVRQQEQMSKAGP